MSLPSPARRRTVTVLSILPWVLVLFQYLIILPRYKKLFDEYGLKLNEPVQTMMALSGWAHAHFVAAFLVTLALTGLSVGSAHVVQVTPVSRRLRLGVLLVVFLVPCLVVLATWVGVSSVERKLVEGWKR